MRRALRACDLRRGGREAEGGGLLNRYTLSRRIVGSNPIPSARTPFAALRDNPKKPIKQRSNAWRLSWVFVLLRRRGPARYG